MYRIEGQIKTIAEILYNVKDESPLSGNVSDAQREARARECVHKTSDGELCIPKPNFKKCLLDGIGSANLKYGKKSLKPYIQATVFVEDDLRFGVSEPDEIDIRWGRIPPRTGAMVKLYRAKMKTGRTLSFSLSVFDDTINEEQIRKGLDQAGIYIGLGAWRPEFGRFIVTKWEVKRESATAKAAKRK